ncbi:MAG: GNAT family N-acetyltransferase [Mycobacteriales bacterium]
MLRGERVLLRARTRADVERMYELEADPEHKMLADTRPWVPYSLATVLEQWDRRHADGPPSWNENFIPFAVDSLATGEMIGGCVLWELDQHNRNAHFGLELLPAARGQGYGTDVVRVLCDYAFRVLGLHRVQLETLARNTAMRKAALAAGFQEEGMLRATGWVGTGWDGDVVYGLLAREWRSLRSEVPTQS